MEAVVFNGHFGWLHPAAGRRGVVLCNALGHEAMWLHKAMRRLAECLALRGLPVLRFDYWGTGDSTDQEDLVRPTDWPDEVVQAVAYLRSVTSVDQVSLAGFRFGATVAAQAAQQLEIESIAMFAPVVSARSFIREMNILQQTWIQKTGPIAGTDQPPSGACDILGHRFSAQALSTLDSLDLRHVQRAPATRVLMLNSGASNASVDLAAHFTSVGASVETGPFENYFQALQPAWLAEVPETTLSIATDWLSHDISSSSSLRVTTFGNAPAIVTPGAVERPLHIADGKIFGMLCEPETGYARPEHTPILIIANTAGTHHAGDGRFNVELARRLAQMGYASLRIDADGIGDSRGAAVSGTIGLIELDAVAADVSSAADALFARGYSDIAVFGICAGAYAGLRAAQHNPSIRGVVLVNPVGLALPDSCTMQNAAKFSAGSPRAHLRSMVHARKWAKVARGEIRLGPVLRRLWRHAVARMQGIAAAWTDDALFTTTKSYRVRSLIKALDASGVHVRLLLSPHDHSLDELEMHFGTNGHRLSKLQHARALIVQNMDHELLNHAARERVLNLCHAMLREAFPATPERNARTQTPESADVPASAVRTLGSMTSREAETEAGLP